MNIVMGHWTSLECWWNSDNQETKSLSLSLVTKAILIDQKVSRFYESQSGLLVFHKVIYNLHNKASSV